MKISQLRPLAGLLLLLSLRAAEPASEDTQISADNFDGRSTDKEMTSIFWGHVVITGTNTRITCDRAEVVSARAGDTTQVVAKQNRFKSLLLIGHVTILQRDSNREATCGRAEILPQADKITLTENPKVVDLDKDGKPEFTYTGDLLTLMRGERHVTGTNIRITAPPLKDLGFDRNKTTPPVIPPPDAPKLDQQK